MPTAGNGSSSISSRTSTSSSTSDGPHGSHRSSGARGAPGAPGPLARLAGFIRLAHPFPSLLNAAATGTIASLAGADPGSAGRLALSMLAMQASIGALNDLVDAPLDAGQKPGKPVPRGFVSPREAGVVAAVAGVVGLALSAASGVATLGAAVAVLALGYGYDLRLSRTSLSWLPLALALPVLPMHAWIGATGELPPGFLALLPAAVLAGGGLALANGLVDVERDATVGRRGSAVRLGSGRAWVAQTVALGIAAVIAVVAAPGGNAVGQSGGSSGSDVLALVRALGVPLGLGAIALGAVALRARGAAIRERGWEVEAVGVASIGIGWLAGAARVAATAAGAGG